MPYRFKLVIIDKNYCDYLRKYDSKVPYNFDKKQNRPCRKAPPAKTPEHSRTQKTTTRTTPQKIKWFVRSIQSLNSKYTVTALIDRFTSVCFPH